MQARGIFFRRTKQSDSVGANKIAVRRSANMKALLKVRIP
jgi:hypothetical protein